ncbi:cobalamin-dependent protein [Candidatus Woesearchaeota archaeon]|nr:cobalamin-dependent protein [Candidatus Woesearchaeota archaeon]
MKIMLINPNSKKPDSIEELPMITPPINMMYVAQILENNSYKAKITDAFAEGISSDEILKRIKKNSPDMIGFPLYSSDLSYMHRLTSSIKNQDENVKIFFAGHHASALNKEVMTQFPDIDFIIRGEGEYPTLNLVEALEKKSPLEKVNGVSFREGKKIRHTPEEKPVKDLDRIPIPSRKLIDPKLYYSKLSKRNKVDVLITSRGCPYRCTFCAKLNQSFRSYRTRSINSVIDELNLIRETGTDGVEIYDEIFTMKKQRALDIMRSIRREKMDFEFRIRTRVTHIDKEILTSLRKAGCSTISYGVESGSQRVLDAIKKDISPRLVEKAFEKTERHGMNVLGFFMIGNKADTPETIRQTISFAKKLNPLFATFGVLHPYPGTVDYLEAKKNNTLQGEYAPNKPMPWIKLPWTKSIEELYRFSDQAYNEYYKRPRYIGKFLKSTLTQGNWNLMKYTLKNFYKKLSRINPI